MNERLITVYAKLIDCKNTIINDVICNSFQPVVCSAEEAISRINQDKCSMSRFGDGEFSLIRGQSLKFQPYQMQLAEELKAILHLSNAEDKMLVCIPDVFHGTAQYIPRAEKYWKKYLHQNRSSIYRLLSFKKRYYDTQITRFYVDYIDKSNMSNKVLMLQSIWDNKRILIVEGEKSRLGMGNNLFHNAACIHRIICPSVDAYSRIDEIEAAVLAESDFDLVLIALGPTATVLAYRLYKHGIQALDIGHIDIEYEWYLKGVQDKEPVPHKYIGEMKGGDVVDDAVDALYESQIIRSII